MKKEKRRNRRMLQLWRSSKMYDALTNLFLVRNIGQVMSLKNELCDMKMNDDDNITSYFVRISQLRDQLQAIE